MQQMLDRTTRSRRSISELNTVPYIDVMLVLLVIFMSTAPMLNRGVDVELPVAEARQMKSSNKELIISLNAKGELFFNQSPAPSSPITAAKLGQELQLALKRNPKQSVILKADKKLNYNRVLDAMVLAQRAGVENIGLEIAS